MPYKDIQEAKSAKFPTTMDGTALTIGQVNSLAQIYDKVKDNADEPMAVAITTFKKAYKKDDDKWVQSKSDMSEDDLNIWAEESVSLFADKKTYSVDGKEIFRIGTWTDAYGRTRTYTEEDLDNIVSAFNAGVRSIDGIPLKLKLGHSDKQTLLQSDGYPAAGWVKSVKRVKDRLVADFKDIPRVIKEFIDRKAYRNVSSELWRNYSDPVTKKEWPLVLGHIALLGGDPPAVKGLGEWSALYADCNSAELYIFKAQDGVLQEDEGIQENEEDMPDSSYADYPGGRVLLRNSKGEPVLKYICNALKQAQDNEFGDDLINTILAEGKKLIEGNEYKELENLINQQEDIMDDKAKIAELEAKLKESEEAKDKLSHDVAQLKEKSEAAEQAALDAEVESFLESRIVKERVRPADKELYKGLLLNASKTETVKFAESDGKTVELSKFEEVKRRIESLPKVIELGEQSESEKKESKKVDNKDRALFTAGSADVHELVMKYMEDHKDVSYSEALRKVAESEDSEKFAEMIEAPLAK